jgi:hypothetical protein
MLLMWGIHLLASNKPAFLQTDQLMKSSMTRAHAIIFSLVGPEYLALLVDNDHCWHDGIVATVPMGAPFSCTMPKVRAAPMFLSKPNTKCTSNFSAMARQSPLSYGLTNTVCTAIPFNGRYCAASVFHLEIQSLAEIGQSPKWHWRYGPGQNTKKHIARCRHNQSVKCKDWRVEQNQTGQWRHQ